MRTESRTAVPVFASRRVRRIVLAATPLVAALALAGCGSSGSSTATTIPGAHAHDSAMGDMPGMDHGSSSSAAGGATSSAATTPSTGASMPGMTPLVAGADGTTSTAGGLTLLAGGTRLTVGKPGKLELLVTNPAGKRVKSFERDQTKLMHLIVVRNDLTGYQHLHPTFHASAGMFTVKATLPERGQYRAIADFTTGGKRYALGVNLTALGGAAAKRTPLPPVSRQASVDGYDVSLADGKLHAGKETKMVFRVTKGGWPETALQPYLGAEGHLVALRSTDLAYSHVHPVSSKPSAGSITFNAEFLAAAKYRLYLQFRAAGVVHTAEFTVDVGA